MLSVPGGKNIRLFLKIATVFLIYGIAIEFIQKYFIPNRSFDLGDIMADMVGISLGLILVSRVYIKK
jgi:VanZ family protein